MLSNVADSVCTIDLEVLKDKKTICIAIYKNGIYK